jgi:histidinol-phosphate/aromatic aminotransferase/cobyric acid decarboxylase-like protein
MVSDFKINYNIERIRLDFDKNYTHMHRMRILDDHSPQLFSFLGGIDVSLFSNYPDMDRSYDLLSNFLDVNRNNLLMGRGSEELIRNIISILDIFPRHIVLHTPNYAMAKVYSEIYRNQIKEYPVENKLDIDLNTNAHQYGLVYLVNPNPYTGGYDSYELENFIDKCRENDIYVLLDEVYSGFGDCSFLVENDINNYQNLIVVRSFSKSYMLPSIRFGYCIGSDSIISKMSTIRSSYELSVLDCKFLESVISNKDYIKCFQDSVVMVREKLKSKYSFLDGDNINLWIDSNYNLYNSMKTNYNIVLGQHNNLDYFSVPINKEIYSKFERELDLCQN